MCAPIYIALAGPFMCGHTCKGLQRVRRSLARQPRRRRVGDVETVACLLSSTVCILLLGRPVLRHRS